MAVTRAKALLIVVGNPRVLNTDPTWARYVPRGFFWSLLILAGLILNSSEQSLFIIFLPLLVCRFIQYCKDEGGYTGFIQAEEDEDVVMRLASLYITIEAQGDRRISSF